MSEVGFKSKYIHCRVKRLLGKRAGRGRRRLVYGEYGGIVPFSSSLLRDLRSRVRGTANFRILSRRLGFCKLYGSYVGGRE